MLLLNATKVVEGIPLWASIPFLLLLAMIAVGPNIAGEWWEQNRNKLLVSVILGIPIVVYLIMNGHTAHLEHQVFGDYVPFLVLLSALFIITGNIHLSGDIEAKPWINTTFLAIGYFLASIMGTTGAAMLLIRPVLSTNSQRKYQVHTVLFFIACVANAGGLLTPLGDPPLFILYLRGASFTWFLSLLPEWAFTGALLLFIYFIVDTYYYKKEPHANILDDASNKIPLHLGGSSNLIFLLGVVLSVAFINPNNIPGMAEHHAPLYLKYLRELVLITLSVLSYATTKSRIRELNKFSWTPIIEVAVVFIGIFVTMTPTLMYLSEHASKLCLDQPWQFYYTTGLLSSFLDNTPTAVAFHSVAQSLVESNALPANLINDALVAGVPELLLKAIATAAVFFGAMTYIGNGPNFMVKSIAEENGVKMPGFMGYIFKFSAIVILPIYILVQIIFM